MSRRYPFAPLAAAMGVSESQAAKHLGISGSTEQQYRRDGMSLKVADRRAVQAGLHPFSVWPAMVDDALEDEQRAEEARKARRKAYRRAYYLANKERALERQREADRRDAETKRKYARWYYRTHREEVLAKQRERDRAKAERLRLLRQLEAELIPFPDRHLLGRSEAA